MTRIRRDLGNSAGGTTATILGSISALIGLATAVITFASVSGPDEPDPITTTTTTGTFNNTSGNEVDGPTREEWAEEANRICAEVSSQTDAVVGSDFATIVSTWDSGIATIQDRLGQLPAPRGDEGTIARMLTLWGEVRQDVLDALDAFSIGDALRTDELIRRADDTTVQINTLAEDMGALECRMETSGF